MRTLSLYRFFRNKYWGGRRYDVTPLQAWRAARLIISWLDESNKPLRKEIDEMLAGLEKAKDVHAVAAFIPREFAKYERSILHAVESREKRIKRNEAVSRLMARSFFPDRRYGTDPL